MRALTAAAFLAGALIAPARAALSISSQTVSDPHQLIGAVLPATTAYPNLITFPEKLIFEVSWGVISVGQATLEVEDIVDFNGTPAYHVVSRAISNKFCDSFYKVRDISESWIDVRTATSLGYSKQLREGSFFRNEWVLFDDGRWLGKRAGRDGNFNVATGTAPVGVQDILSSMYYLRGRTLTPGSEIVLDVNTRQNWPLVVRVLRRDRVKTPAGDFDALLVEPMLRQEGLFIQKGNRLQVWLSDDSKHVPVLMKVEVFFGSITARLAKMVY